MSFEPVSVSAPAKLTVGLRVVGVRGDGYHLIEAEMVSLDLCDTLTITEGRGVQYIDAASGSPVDVGSDDLVSRALVLAGRDVSVSVSKQIAPGAGLGGGSSDAAAILRWAGFTDPVAASVLGADVAFCLVGGRARVTGIGEVIEPLAFEARTYTLVTPPFGCSTPKVYRAWDDMGGPRGDHGNDLEPAALMVAPGLAVWRDELAEETGQRPSLAGSGSTWFVEGAHPAPGRVIAHTVRS
jgi:4-diphosphocytidyl-2-C-methyl-D-erythritol kinase